MLDFNRTVMQAKSASDDINAVIDAAIGARDEEPREYLGASSIGHDCLRKIQLDWRAPIQPEPRIRRIFDRGHWWETYCVALMVKAGFRFAPRNAIGFSQLDGLFKGHGDGMLTAGPAVESLSYPCLWECKGLGSKGWTKLGKDGLAKAYPGYADQVALYQAYFDLTEPALFTAANMDTMELLHLLVPFDAGRAQAASDRAVRIVVADLAGEELPKVSADGDDFRCRMCSHKDRCWA